MKKKLFTATLLVMFMMTSSFSNLLIAQESNAVTGSTNFFEKYYGKTIESSMRGQMDALVYIDMELQDGKVLDALAALGYTVTVATDWYDFSTKLGSNNYGLAVGFNQQWSWTTTGAKPTVMAAFATYIANGGSIVYGDWKTDNDIAALFEAQFTGINNQSLMTLDPSIANGLPNPLTLANPGWSIFSTGLTALGGGQVLATFPNGDASIVRGNGGRTIILGYLSDTPPEANRQQLFENLFQGVAPSVPLSDWAIYLGIFLIAAFMVLRYRRKLA